MASYSVLRSRRRNTGLAWIVPALILSVGVLYYCIGYTGFISMTKWDGASPERIFTGLENYTQLATDPVVRRSLAHTAVFFVMTFSVQVFLGLNSAVILHSRVHLRDRKSV